MRARRFSSELTEENLPNGRENPRARFLASPCEPSSCLPCVRGGGLPKARRKGCSRKLTACFLSAAICRNSHSIAAFTLSAKAQVCANVGRWRRETLLARVIDSLFTNFLAKRRGVPCGKILASLLAPLSKFVIPAEITTQAKSQFCAAGLNLPTPRLMQKGEPPRAELLRKQRRRGKPIVRRSRAMGFP